MSDCKEVKRFWPRANESGAVFMDQESDGGYVKYTDHIRSIAELRAEVEKWRAKVDGIANCECAYCDWNKEVGQVTYKDLQEHIQQCAHHPIFKLTKELTEARAEVVGLLALIEGQETTIATQAKVIEKLKDQRDHMANRYLWATGSQAFETSNFDKELAAIEKEGAKDDANN